MQPACFAAVFAGRPAAARSGMVHAATGMVLGRSETWTCGSPSQRLAGAALSAPFASLAVPFRRRFVTTCTISSVSEQNRELNLAPNPAVWQDEGCSTILENTSGSTSAESPWAWRASLSVCRRIFYTHDRELEDKPALRKRPGTRPRNLALSRGPRTQYLLLPGQAAPLRPLPWPEKRVAVSSTGPAHGGAPVRAAEHCDCCCGDFLRTGTCRADGGITTGRRGTAAHPPTAFAKPG